MRHNLCIEGQAFRLRPITDDDAAMVVELRGNPDHNRYMHVEPNSIEAQLAWLRNYYQRSGDYYFVLEHRRDNSAEGVVSIYDIDPSGRFGEWGRWILRPGSLGAIESAWLVYRAAFELLGLEAICCRTNAVNLSVVSFHDSCKITARRVLPKHFEIGGKKFDAVEHCVDRASWVELEPRLSKLAQLTARRVLRA